MGLSSATQRKPMTSVQKRCETSRSRTLRTTWLTPRGGWARAGAAGASSFDMVPSMAGALLYSAAAPGGRCRSRLIRAPRRAYCGRAASAGAAACAIIYTAGYCVTPAHRLPCPLTEASRSMTGVLKELTLSYAVLSGGRRYGSASAVHEPNPADLPYRASSVAPAGPSARATPPRPSPESSTALVRLHLKPGQKGTKQLLAQYGDRLICVRYRYDAQRKKRFKTVELLVAERDWQPPRPRSEERRG